MKADGAKRKRGGAAAAAFVETSDSEPSPGESIRSAFAAIHKLPMDESPGNELHFLARYMRDCGGEDEDEAEANLLEYRRFLAIKAGGRRHSVCNGGRGVSHAPDLHAELRALLRRHGSRFRSP